MTQSVPGAWGGCPFVSRFPFVLRMKSRPLLCQERYLMLQSLPALFWWIYSQPPQTTSTQQTFFPSLKPSLSSYRMFRCSSLPGTISWEFAFLPGFQMMLMLLVQRPHVVNYQFIQLFKNSHIILTFPVSLSWALFLLPQFSHDLQLGNGLLSSISITKFKSLYNIAN